VADVLYYYGDDVPNFVFLKEDLPELKFGYDWDKCSKEIILNRVAFDGHKIVLPDGMSYRLMMLPNEKAIDLKVLRKLDQLVKAGMTLVGSRPVETTGLAGFPTADSELLSIVNKLWGKMDGKSLTENRYGKGRVIWGKPINDILAEMKVEPDLTFKGTHPKTALDYIHRHTDQQEIYFVCNRFGQMKYNDFEYRYLTTLPDRYEQVECSFRVSGKVPEFWNPITGESSEILTYREENGRTIVPLLFEPEGSKFIVFKDAPQKAHVVEIKKDNQLFFDTTMMSLSGEWEIRFDTKWGAPAQVKTSELKSWTEFEDTGIKYYSGTATYHKTIALTPSDISKSRLVLDLGFVKEMASVKINGHQSQVLWCAPFCFDITDYVKPGTNDLEVEVVNMWVNRLVGDGKLPAEKRLTKTNINKFDAPDAEKYLRVSGLMGPVNLKIVKHQELR
jgi:hypothetical protein